MKDNIHSMKEEFPKILFPDEKAPDHEEMLVQRLLEMVCPNCDKAEIQKAAVQICEEVL